MELKYVGLKPVISEHGISFKDGKEDKYVYISLFGINKIEEIKEKILNKVSNQANFINKAKRFFGSSKIVGVDISSILSSLITAE